MTRTDHNKLVRDRIPDLIRAEGGSCAATTLRGESYQAALLEKLIEEAREAGAALDHEALISELADVFEVIDALLEAAAITPEQVLYRKVSRRQERGGFGEGVFLLWSEKTSE